MGEGDLREAIVAATRRLEREGFNRGASGNVSVRHGGGFLVTPTGIVPDDLDADSIVTVTEDGTATGLHPPSSEWRIHRDIYLRRADAGAVVHVHSTAATAVACLRRDIPAFHYMVAVAGGRSIRCAPYATFGTQALSDHTLDALEGRRACLLANHGMIALGPDLAATLRLVGEVETLAAQYLAALQVGEPMLLDDDEMGRVLERFRAYGSGRKSQQSGEEEARR